MSSITSKHFSSVNLSRLCWWAFAAHLLPLVVLIVKTAPWMTSDSGRYIALSESLAGGRSFGLGAEALYEPEGWRLPGYPLFIAAGRFVAGGNDWGIVLIQAALFLAAVWLVYKTAVRAFGALTGLVFLVFSAVYPFVAYSAGQISPEMPVVFLVSLAFFLLSDLTTRRATRRVALAALLIGLSAYIRPNLLPLNFALAAALVLMNWSNYRKALLMVAIAIVVAFPWAARNYQLFGKFTPVPVIRGSGASLLLASWQSRVSIPSLVEYGMNGNFTSEAKLSGMADQISSLNRQLGVPESTIFVSPQAYPGNQTKLKTDVLFTEAAIANIKNYPIEYLKSCLSNSLRMWFSAYFPERFPAVIRYGLLAEGILVLVMGLGGVLVTARARDKGQKPALVLFIMTFLYFSATLCWLHTEARYTIPARLLLLLFAAQFVSTIIGGKFSTRAAGFHLRPGGTPEISR